jgi:hypothetical protein
MNATIDLYVDYLICSTKQVTATGLSRATHNAVSHDKITRLLSSKSYTSADLWKVAKPVYNAIKSDGGVLAIDDTIEEKPYTDENDIIAWHFDHAKKRKVKGINFVTSLYSADKGSLPVGYKIVEKTETVVDKKGKEKRKSKVSKNEHYRNLVSTACNNNLNFKYVLNDCWFASSENMHFVKNECKHDFIMAIKSNRLIALSENDKKLGKFVRIDSLELGASTLVWLKGVEFPLRLAIQRFKNEDGSTGTRYLVSSDIELTYDQVIAIYHKRWKVETYHQSLKNNHSLAKSPTKTVLTQANHLFLSLCAYIRLEFIAIIKGKNQFHLKSCIYLEALRKAFFALEKFCVPQDFHILIENTECGAA